MGKQWKQRETLFLGASNSLQMVTAARKLKDTCSLEDNYDQLRQNTKKQSHYFAYNGPSSQRYVFPVVMYGCESWPIKKAEHRIIGAFELWCWRRLLRVPWTARRSNQSILKEIWVFFGRTEAKAETPILWPPHVKSWRIGKDSDAGRDWGKEKGTTEDEMAGGHHQLDER